jgi:hypothetical protein
MSVAAFPVLVKKAVFVDETSGKQFQKTDAKAAKGSQTSSQAIVDGKLVWVEPFGTVAPAAAPAAAPPATPEL